MTTLANALPRAMTHAHRQPSARSSKCFATRVWLQRFSTLSLVFEAKARLPLSVRLFGRIYFRAGGDVKFGNGVCLVGNVVPIEIVSHEGFPYFDRRSYLHQLRHVHYSIPNTSKLGATVCWDITFASLDQNEHGIKERECGAAGRTGCDRR